MKIAIVGNQNSGKTSLFNLLTKSNQKIGNWPGVTIEKKVGIIKGTNNQLIDLPGIYSLSPYSLEEEVSRKFIFEEKPDLIINIIDATSIERSLYLTTQLLELDTKVLVVLNMTDILEKKGLIVDENKLSELLNTTVIKVSALRKTNIDKLIDIITNDKVLPNKNIEIYDTKVEEQIKLVSKHITTIHKRFVSVKLLEEDILFENQTNKYVKSAISVLEDEYDLDLEQVIANQRYNYITDIKNSCIKKNHHDKLSITDKLDTVFLNKYLALPIFAVIMFMIYMLSVGVVGAATVGFMEDLIQNIQDYLSEFLDSVNASDWAISLVVDGIIGGVGAVLTFIPQLTILFLCIVLLETTGYMSRIAFILDKVFVKFGLSGKTLIPFIVGTGCSVPGVMSTKMIENTEERQMAIVLTPFIPCSAKLPIIALFAGFFFPDYSGLISASLYFLSVFIIVLSAVILKKLVYKTKHSTFISELPEYKRPSLSYVVKDVLEKVLSFIKRAGSIILVSSVIVWFLISFSFKFEYGVDIDDSMLAGIGNLFAWLFYPMLGSWSWAASVSAIQGLVAKEGVVSSMEVIAGVAEGNVTELFNGGVFGFFNPASAYAFMAFNLFSAPCFGALAAMRRELGSKKKMIKAALIQTGFAFLIAYIVFGIGSLIILL